MKMKMTTGVNRVARAVRHALMLSASSAVCVAPAIAQQASQPTANSELEEVVVTGLQFNAPTVVSANKMPRSILETPQSVQVVTQDMIDFSGLTNFNDMYKLDAGGHATYSRAGVTWLFFRGFSNGINNSYRVDGFRQNGMGMSDLAPYESIEIVKGAVATMFGQSGVAGTVNAVTKRPRKDFGASVSLETGEYSHYRGDVDIYGSLTKDEKLAGRLVAAYTDEGSPFTSQYQKRVVVAPSLKYEFNDSTSLLLQFTYQHLDSSASVGLPIAVDLNGPGGAINSNNYQIPNIPYSQFGSGPDWSHMRKDFYVGNARVEHVFANDWNLRANLQYSHLRGQYKWVWPGAFRPISADPEDVTNIYTYFGEDDATSYSGEVNLFGPVELFGREHTLFLGIDTARINTAFLPYAGAFLSGQTTGFNIYHPDWSLIPEPSINEFAPGGAYGASNFFTNYQRFEKNYGVTAQFLLRPTDALTVDLGVRFSHYAKDWHRKCCTYAASSGPYSDYTEFYPTQEATTFQGGATYALTENINLYGTYGQSFDVRNDFAYDPANPTGKGTFLGPDEGETYEVGVKGELFNKRAFWSLALFNTERTNVTGIDPLHRQYRTAAGAQRSRGAELELQGKLLPGWDLYVSATSMINKYTDGENTGITSPLGPRFGLSAYSSYQFQEGALRGFGLGGGVVHQHRPDFQLSVTNTPAGLQRGVSFPHLFGDYTTVDVRTFYDTNLWHYEISATNVLDERFFSSTHAWLNGQIAINPPRQVMGKVSRRF